ncbi:MAG TPA: polysaccharide deacetylase family protein [Bryobacteraceae bacterium]|nr:polysaccharide deacetylase family protein [Bryobacteraceae bacterium]
MQSGIATAASTAAAAALAGAGLLAWAVRGRASHVFGDSVWRGSRATQQLALTFDDGPSESTPALLAILERHRVPATFFMCGRNVQRCPNIAHQVVIAGHEPGNHSHTHPRFDFKSPEFIFQELATAQQIIQSTTGATPRWFRAPYGVRWFGVGPAQLRLGLTGAMWTIIGRDWRWPGPQVASRLIAKSAPGSILCLHDGRVLEPNPDIRATLEAVEQAIPRLQDRGFQFVTLSQMFPSP